MSEEYVSNKFCTHSISGKDRTRNNSKNTRYYYSIITTTVLSDIIYINELDIQLFLVMLYILLVKINFTRKDTTIYFSLLTEQQQQFLKIIQFVHCDLDVGRGLKRTVSAV